MDRGDPDRRGRHRTVGSLLARPMRLHGGSRGEPTAVRSGLSEVPGCRRHDRRTARLRRLAGGGLHTAGGPAAVDPMAGRARPPARRRDLATRGDGGARHPGAHGRRHVRRRTSYGCALGGAGDSVAPAPGRARQGRTDRLRINVLPLDRRLRHGEGHRPGFRRRPAGRGRRTPERPHPLHRQVRTRLAGMPPRGGRRHRAYRPGDRP